MIIRFLQKYFGVLLRFVGVLGVWFFMLVIFSAIPGVTNRVDVFLASESLINSLPADVAIVAVTDRRLTLESARDDLALSLYRAGAKLVITSQANGCMDLRPQRVAALPSKLRVSN